MQELENIKLARVELQDKYLKDVQNVWDDTIEATKKDSKARKMYKEYKHKDLFLEKIQATLESAIEDIEYYNQNMWGK